MTSRLLPAALAALALGGCAEKPSAPPAPEHPQPFARAAPQPAPLLPALTLEGYKKEWARKVAAASADTYDEPVPEMLKSIVVLEVTIDRDGRLARVAVRRSNGYKALERRAMDSVRSAAPYEAPSWSARRGAESVSFFETFLFRDDGRFRIRSLVD